MAHMDSVSRIFSPLSDVVPFTHRNGLTMLQIQELLRKKLNDLISSQNTMNQHLRTTEDGLQERFTELYNTAAANIDVFETRIETKFSEVSAELDTMFDTLQDGINTQFDTLQTGINTQFTGLQTSFNAAFANLTTENRTDFATLENELTAQIDSLVASVTASTGASEQSAANAAMSAATAATQATNAATSAADAAASAAAAITVGDNYVASLFNELDSETRAAVGAAMAAEGAWFGTDPEAPNAMVTPLGLATFKNVQTDDIMVKGTSLEDLLATKPSGLVDYGVRDTIVSGINVETPIMELRVTAAKRRIFNISLQPFAMQSTVGGDAYNVRIRAAYDGVPVTVESPIIANDTLTTPSANTPVSFRGLLAKINTGTWSAAREIRFLVTANRASGTGIASVPATAITPVVLELNDLGIAKAPSSTGTTEDGSVKQTYTTTWYASDLYGYNGVKGSAKFLGSYFNLGQWTNMNHVQALFNAVSVAGEIGVTLNSVLGNLALSDLVKAELYVYAQSGTIGTQPDIDGLTYSVARVNVHPSDATIYTSDIAYPSAPLSFGGFPAGKWVDISNAIGLSTRSIHVRRPYNDSTVVVENSATNPIQLRLTYKR